MDLRRKGVRNHVRVWMIAGLVMMVFNVFLPGAGIFSYWSLYLIFLWGGFVLLHAVTYVGWKQDQERHEVHAISKARRDAKEAYGSAHRMYQELEQAYTSAVEAVTFIGDPGVVSLGELDVGMRHAQHLFRGYGRLGVVLDMLSGEDGSRGDEAITEARWAIERTEEARLRKLYEAKLDLLRSREEKVKSLKKDMERIEVCIEGFLLAAGNLQLDATRYEASKDMAFDASGLHDSTRRLAEEVAILKEVEAELEGL